MERTWLLLAALGVFTKAYAHAVRRGAMLPDAPRQSVAAGAGVGGIQLLALMLGRWLSGALREEAGERAAALLSLALGLLCGLPMLHEAWRDDRPEECRQQGLTPCGTIRYALRLAPVSAALGALRGWRAGHSPVAMGGMALAAAAGTSAGLLVGMRRGYGSKRAAGWLGGAAWLGCAALTVVGWLK